MMNNKRNKIVTSIIEDYVKNSEVCMCEYLATEPVPSNLTFEDAFLIYAECMNRVEGDSIYVIKEGKVVYPSGGTNVETKK